MFLHLGGDVIVPIRDIIGIFDFSAGDEPINEEFLAMAGEEGFVVDLIQGEKKSFVLVNEQVYLSPIASSTLRKRWIERRKDW